MISSQVDARNVDGSTPLCDACSSSSLDCVRLLLEHGAKANAALTSRTASPLHEACMGGYFNSILASSAFGLNMETYMTVFCLPLFRKCRLCEASDCSGCWSGGVWSVLWDPFACGLCKWLHRLCQSAAQCRQVSSWYNASKTDQMNNYCSFWRNNEGGKPNHNHPTWPLTWPQALKWMLPGCTRLRYTTLPKTCGWRSLRSWWSLELTSMLEINTTGSLLITPPQVLSLPAASPSMKVSDSLPWLYHTDVAPAHFLLYWPHKSDKAVV